MIDALFRQEFAQTLDSLLGEGFKRAEPVNESDKIIYERGNLKLGLSIGQNSLHDKKEGNFLGVSIDLEVQGVSARTGIDYWKLGNSTIEGLNKGFGDDGRFRVDGYFLLNEMNGSGVRLSQIKLWYADGTPAAEVANAILRVQEVLRDVLYKNVQMLAPAEI